MHLFCFFSSVLSCKMASFCSLPSWQTNMAPPDRRGIAANLPKPTVSRRSHILLCGSCPCAFTPFKLNNRMIMDGVSRDCQTAWNRRFSAGSNGTPVFDSRLSQKVCNTHVEAGLAGPGRYAGLDVQNPNLQRATRTQPDTYLHCGIGPRGLPRAQLTSLLAGLAFLRGLPMQPSRPEPRFLRPRSGSPPPARRKRKSSGCPTRSICVR